MSSDNISMNELPRYTTARSSLTFSNRQLDSTANTANTASVPLTKDRQLGRPEKLPEDGFDAGPVSRNPAAAPPRLIFVPEVHTDVKLGQRRDHLHDLGLAKRLWVLQEGVRSDGYQDPRVPIAVTGALAGARPGDSGGLFGWEDGTAAGLATLLKMTDLASNAASVESVPGLHVLVGLVRGYYRFVHGVHCPPLAQLAADTLCEVLVSPELVHAWKQLPRPFSGAEHEKLAQRIDRVIGAPSGAEALGIANNLLTGGDVGGARVLRDLARAWGFSFIEAASTALDHPAVQGIFDGNYDPTASGERGEDDIGMQLRNRAGARSAVAAYDLASAQGNSVWFTCGYAHVPGIASEVWAQRPDIPIARLEAPLADVVLSLEASPLRAAYDAVLRRIEIVADTEIALLLSRTPRDTAPATSLPLTSSQSELDWEII